MSRGPASAAAEGRGWESVGVARHSLLFHTEKCLSFIRHPRPTPRSVIFQTGPYLVLAPPGRLTSGQNGLRFFSSTWPGVQNLTSTFTESVFIKLFRRFVSFIATLNLQGLLVGVVGGGGEGFRLLSFFLCFHPFIINKDVFFCRLCRLHSTVEYRYIHSVIHSINYSNKTVDSRKRFAIIRVWYEY